MDFQDVAKQIAEAYRDVEVTKLKWNLLADLIRCTVAVLFAWAVLKILIAALRVMVL